MPVEMSKKEQKIYYKNLRKRIYQKEFDKTLAQNKRVLRKNRIKDIQNKARRDANVKSFGGNRLKQGLSRLGEKARSLEEKRQRMAKKVTPYYNNLNSYMNNQFNIYKKK